MPFNSTIGSTFNCGFCLTVVYKYLAEKREDMQKSKDSQSKPSESKESTSVDSLQQQFNRLSVYTCNCVFVRTEERVLLRLAAS